MLLLTALFLASATVALQCKYDSEHPDRTGTCTAAEDNDKDACPSGEAVVAAAGGVCPPLLHDEQGLHVYPICPPMRSEADLTAWHEHYGEGFEWRHWCLPSTVLFQRSKTPETEL